MTSERALVLLVGVMKRVEGEERNCKLGDVLRVEIRSLLIN